MQFVLIDPELQVADSLKRLMIEICPSWDVQVFQSIVKASFRLRAGHPPDLILLSGYNVFAQQRFLLSATGNIANIPWAVIGAAADHRLHMRVLGVSAALTYPFDEGEIRSLGALLSVAA